MITNEIIESNTIHYISASLKDNNLKFYRFTTKNGKSNFYDQDGKSSKKKHKTETQSIKKGHDMDQGLCFQFYNPKILNYISSRI